MVGFLPHYTYTTSPLVFAPRAMETSAAESGPFARLLSELLTKVFLYLRDDAGGFDWIKATATCVQWRQIALDSPILWSKFRIMHRTRPALVYEALRRSIQVELDITIGDIVGEGDLELASHLLGPHAKRLKSLKLEFDLDATGEVNTFLEKFGSGLTTLRLMADTAGELDPRANLQVLKLPQMSSLRLLSIKGVVCEVTQGALAGLTALDMSDLSKFHVYAPRLPVCVDHVFRTLLGCTNLRRLTLSEVFASTDLQSDRVLRFPLAREVHLREVDIAPARILPRFSLSQGTTVHVTSVFNAERWEEWYQDRRGNGVLKCALPGPPLDEDGERLHPGPTSAYFRAVDREFTFGGYVDKNGTPYVATVDVSRYTTQDHGRMMLTALADFRDLVDTSRIVNLEIHVAPYLEAAVLCGPAVPWPWVSHTFRPVHTLTVGGACTVVSFLDVACAIQFRGVGIKDLTLCLHDITLPVVAAFRRCAKKTKEISRRVIAPDVKIRLPPKLEANDADKERLYRWASELSSWVKIEFRFEHCECCSRMVPEDWTQLARDDAMVRGLPSENAREKARRVCVLLESVLRECNQGQYASESSER
ncbi:hypothetical protein BV20DRAFT_964863 [Pilatotrama ljubarskyi]|nr:hypothetical protein BV20DRAFT_964863 [Pilatotrama ljubarskyi]